MRPDRRPTAALAAVLGAALASCAASAAELATTATPPPIVARVCTGCHGLDGNASWPIVPRLAGQNFEYLSNQLAAYRAAPKPPSIEWPAWLHEPAAVPANARSGYDARTFMTGPAHDLPASESDAALRWYSSRTPGRGRPGVAALVEAGRDIFQNGVPLRGVPACSACHGPDALGTGPFPRLAGQHAAYVVVQLEGFKSGDRPLGTEMLAVTKALTATEMAAVAGYLQSL